MAALTEARDTREYACNAERRNLHLAVAGGETIPAGALAAIDENGEAVNASDTDDAIIVAGRAERTASGGESVVIRSGAFLYCNGSGDEEIKRTDIGSPCYALDNQTVGLKGGTNGVFAGIVLDVDEARGEVAVEVGNVSWKTLWRPETATSDPPAACAANMGRLIVLGSAVSGTNIASGATGDVYMSNGTSWVKLN